MFIPLFELRVKIIYANVALKLFRQFAVAKLRPFGWFFH